LLFVLLFFGPGENVTILLRADFGESSSNVTHTRPVGHQAYIVWASVMPVRSVDPADVFRDLADVVKGA